MGLPVGQTIKVLLKAGVSAALLAILLRQVDFASIGQTLQNASPPLIFLVVAIHIADRWLMAWKWRLLVTASSHDLSVYDAFKIYYVASFQGALVPLGIGPDILRLYSLKRRGVSNEIATASIVVERLVGLMATVVVALLSLILLLRTTGHARAASLVLLASLILLVALTVIAAARLCRPGLGKLKETSAILPLSKVHARLNRSSYFRAIVAFRHHRRVLARFFLWSMCEQLAPVIAVFVTSLALNMSVPFLACLAVVPIGSLLERLPIAFMGVGIREGSFAVLLPLFGIPYSQAILLSALEFGLFLISLTPAAIWSLASPRTESRMTLPRTEEAGGDSTAEL